MLPLLRICEYLILFGFQQPAARIFVGYEVLSVVFILDVWALDGTEPLSAFSEVRSILVFENISNMSRRWAFAEWIYHR